MASACTMGCYVARLRILTSGTIERYNLLLWYPWGLPFCFLSFIRTTSLRNKPDIHTPAKQKAFLIWKLYDGKLQKHS